MQRHSQPARERTGYAVTQGQKEQDEGADSCASGMQTVRAAPAVSGAALPGLILDHARDGIALLDIRGRILWMNPALERMLGWPLDLIRGRNPAELINPPENRPSRDQLSRFRYIPGSSLFDDFRVTRHMRRDGTRFWNQQSHALIDAGPTDSQKMVVVTCRDISEQVRVQTALVQLKDDLEHAAYHDDLTGLGNRKKLSRYLACDPVRASIQAGRVGVLQLDLDKFKQINDTLGHAAGDSVLRHLARGLADCTQPGDLICRTGGDEFLLICLNLPDKAALLQRADAVLRAAGRPLDWKDQTIVPGISIGASMCDFGVGTGTAPSGQCVGEMLIQQADQALYAAKEGGRGRAVLYTHALGARYVAERQLARDLAHAIKLNQFTIYLQPILDLRQGRITSCEALLRWHHPTRGLLAPGDFMDAALQAQLLSQIDYLAMNAALDALAALHAQGFDDLCLSLNVSSAILEDADYAALLDWALQSRGLSPSCICVEVQETAIAGSNTRDATATVTRLRRLGVRVMLDDFGTGYAGLAHMSSVQLDAIKLDRSMICRLEHDARARVITRAIIHLCALLGMQVVAEGVETQGQLDILRRAKCPMVQGYGIARPMPLEQIALWLQANRMLASPLILPIGGARRCATKPARRRPWR